MLFLLKCSILSNSSTIYKEIYVMKKTVVQEPLLLIKQLGGWGGSSTKEKSEGVNKSCTTPNTCEVWSDQVLLIL